MVGTQRTFNNVKLAEREKGRSCASYIETNTIIDHDVVMTNAIKVE